MPFEASQAIFRPPSNQKESKLSKTSFKSWTLASFCSRCQITAFEVQACTGNPIFSQLFLEKVIPCPLDFYLLLSLLPASFAFVAFAFASFAFAFAFFCWAFTRLPFGGKRFAKSLRIVKCFWRKYEWVVGQDINWNFLVKVTCFFAFFFLDAWLNRAHLVMAWNISSPCRSLLSKLSRTIKTDDITSNTRDVVKQGRFRWFRGECVKLCARYNSCTQRIIFLSNLV